MLPICYWNTLFNRIFGCKGNVSALQSTTLAKKSNIFILYYIYVKFLIWLVAVILDNEGLRQLLEIVGFKEIFDI